MREVGGGVQREVVWRCASHARGPAINLRMKEQIYPKSPRDGSQAEVMAEHPPLTEATKNWEMEAKTPTPRAASQGKNIKRSATTPPKQHGKMSGNQKLVLAFFEKRLFKLSGNLPTESDSHVTPVTPQAIAELCPSMCLGLKSLKSRLTRQNTKNASSYFRYEQNVGS